jgi:heme A synthase
MGFLFDPLTPLNFPDLFTLLWVGSIIIVLGAIVVYNAALRRNRRYPQLLALHEWIFWAIVVPWGLVPLLVVIHVPLIIILLLVVPGMAVAFYAAFVRYPPLLAAANDEIRRRRFVPPARRAVQERPRPTPAGRRRKHRRR